MIDAPLSPREIALVAVAVERFRSAEAVAFASCDADSPTRTAAARAAVARRDELADTLIRFRIPERVIYMSGDFGVWYEIARGDAHVMIAPLAHTSYDRGGC